MFVAWQCAQQLRQVYHQTSPAEGRRLATKIIDSFPSCPIPEIARLGRTLKRWRAAFLAYFDTGGSSNGDRRGRTVLLSSHILAEVEALCDRVTIIRQGRSVETGTLSDMRHLTRTSIMAELAGAPNGLSTMAGVHDLLVDGNKVRFEVDTSQLDAALRQLTSVGVRSLISQPPTLEELFLRHYQDDLRSVVGAGASS